MDFWALFWSLNRTLVGWGASIPPRLIKTRPHRVNRFLDASMILTFRCLGGLVSGDLGCPGDVDINFLVGFEVLISFFPKSIDISISIMDNSAIIKPRLSQ